MKEIKKYAVLFTAGGSVYYLIEILWRLAKGRTPNPVMFLVGGLAFICLGLINEWIPWDMPLTLQCVIGGGIVTAIEFFSGCALNLWLGMGIWDYSSMPFNILGQICLPFSLLWCLLAVVGIVMDDYIRYRFFGEEKPRYRIM